MKKEPIRVMLIEDDLGYARLISEMISDAKGQSFVVEHQRNLDKGLKRLSRGGVDVILLDLLLTDSNGLDTFLTVRNRANEIPIVVLTGIENKNTALTAVRRGAQDYLFKREITPGLLTRALSYAVLRKKTEEELVESKLKLRAQYMGIPIPTYTWQKKKEGFVLLNYNNAALSVTDGKISGYLGKIANEIFVDEKEILRDLYGCYRKKTTVKREIIDRSKFFGSEQNLTISYTYVPPDLVLIHTEDTAERAKDEKALRRTTNFFETTLRASTDGVVITDFSQNIIMVNEAFCKILGVDFREVTETNLFDWLEHFEGDVKKRWTELEKRVRKAGVSRDVEFTKISGDKEIHLSVNASLVEQVSDEEIGVIVSIWRDITEKKLAEEELQKAKGELEVRIEERTFELKEANKELQLEVTERKQAQEMLNETEEMYRLVTDTMEDSAWMMDMNFVTIYTNPSTTHLRGYTSEELKKMPMEINLTPESLKIAKKRISEEMTPERLAQKDLDISATVDLEFYRKGGATNWYEIRASLIRDEDGNPHKILGVSRDISKRKKAEEALRESELKYRNLFENSISPIFTVDLEGNFTSANKALEEIWGYKVSEVVGANYKKFVNPEVAEEIFNAYNNLFCTREPIRNLVYSFIRKDGEGITVECYIDVICEGEKIVGFQGTLRDITEQKQAEMALKESEERLKAILNATTEVVSLIALDGTLLAINNALAKSLGRKKAELIGKNIYEIIPEEVAESRKARVQRVVKSRKPLQWEDENEGKFFNNSIYPILDDNGNVNQIAVFAKDITDRKQMEERLHFLALAIEQSGEGIATSDLEGNLSFVNNAFATMHGYSVDELIGQNLSIFHNSQQLPAVEAANREIAETGKFKGEILNCHRDGSVFPTLMNNSIIRDVDGNAIGMLASVRDITERKWAEEALRKSEAKLKEAQQIAHIGNWDIDYTANPIYYWSDEMYRIFNQTPETFIPTYDKIIELIHPDDQEIVNNFTIEILQNRQEKFTYEHRIINPDGSIRYVISTGNVIYDKEGTALSVYGVAQDITEQKRAEEALREIKEKYRLLVENANEVILVGQEGKVVFANRKAFEQLGYSEEELFSINIFEELIHPDDRQMVLENHFKRIRGEDLPHVYPFRVIDHEENVRWVEINSVFIEWDGKPATLNFLKEITERKVIGEALRESEEKHRLLVDNSFDGIIVLQDGVVKFLNKRGIERYIEYSDSESSTVSFIDLVHPDDRETIIEQYKMKMGGEKVSDTVIFRLVERDGKINWAEANGVPITWEGKPAMQVFIRNITEKVMAEEALRFQSSISEQVTNSIVVADTDFKIIYVNKAAKEMYGYSEEEFLGKPPDFVRAEPDGNNVSENIYSTVSSGKVWMGSSKDRRKDGTVFDSELKISPMFNNSGEIIAYVGVINNITFRKEWEYKMISVAQEWRATFDSFSDKISILDKDYRYIKVNKAFADVFNLHPRDVVGRVSYELEHRLKQPPPNCLHREVIETSGFVVREEFDTETGVYTETTISPIFNDSGEITATVNFSKDITERKIADEKIKQSLVEKEILLKEVHHRVKNNLQVISSLLDMDSMRMDKSESSDFIRDARSRIHTMALIHTQLYQSKRFDKINLAKHINDLIRYISVVHFSRETEIDHTIEDFDVTLPVTQAIPLGLVLNELITNIYKHAFKTVQKGTLKCEMRKSSQDIVTVVVRDNGVGLPSGFDIDKVKGLGLRLVRNLVREQLKGEITVNRVEGTEFVIKFKIVMEDDEDVQNTGS